MPARVNVRTAHPTGAPAGTTAALATASPPFSAGTKLSSPVDAAGTFQLGGVPTGDVQLVFGGSDARSTVSLSNVLDQEVIELQIAIVEGRAKLEREVRGISAGKLVLCHLAGNGGYHLIEVSVSAESAHRAHGDGKVGEAVPGSPGRVFTSSCTTQ